MPGPQFELGQVVGTPGAIERMRDLRLDSMHLLRRHVSGDWGNVSKADAKENWLSVREGFRILSSYGEPGQAIWIITEADRSATTFLLPEEY